MKQNIIDEEIKIKSNLPSIDSSMFTDRIRNVFLNKLLPLDLKTYILDSFSFSDQKNIEELEKKLNSLKSINIETEISLRTQKQLKASSMLSNIKSNNKFIEEKCVLLNSLIENYKSNKLKVEELTTLIFNF